MGGKKPPTMEEMANMKKLTTLLLTGLFVLPLTFATLALAQESSAGSKSSTSTSTRLRRPQPRARKNPRKSPPIPKQHLWRNNAKRSSNAASPDAGSNQSPVEAALRFACLLTTQPS
jgi:hypothetical protein